MRRVLLIESGSRSTADKWLRWLNSRHPGTSVDLLTCYEGHPPALNGSPGAIFRTYDYPASDARQKLIEEFRANRYDVLAILCSAEPVMTRWKWFVGAKVHSKVMVLNENADWFWLDSGHWPTVREFVSVRMGLSGSGAFTQPVQLLSLPFTIVFLAIECSWIFLRRRLS